ncbi:MAG: NADH:flavin oxidoreductase [Cellvibrionales bacterium]|nr:NADH:flavin oxidoreductase [Cellvibrionales bacterium]
MTSPFQPASINSLQLKNRFIKAGTFENMTPGGMPSERLHQFHQQMAEGGIGMTTLGYCAVENNGRLHDRMMYMGEHIRDELSTLIQSLHQAGTKVSGQMGHGGGFSQNTALTIKRPKGPNFGINALGIPKGMFFCDAMNKKDIDSFIRAYKDAALFMKSVGFDCLEIHFGHGYGLCQFLSPKTNKRNDEFGGSLSNRMRLPLKVLSAVRAAVGDDFPLLAKVSITEGARGGIQFNETLKFCQALDKEGIDAIIPSTGSSTMNPMLMFRGENMLPHLLRHEKSALMRLILKLSGKALFKTYPYSPLYLKKYAAEIKDSVNAKLIYVGGASTVDDFTTLIDQGFDFIQLGRSLLAEPLLPNKLEHNNPIKACTHCNQCLGTIAHDEGIHCPYYL